MSNVSGEARISPDVDSLNTGVSTCTCHRNIGSFDSLGLRFRHVGALKDIQKVLLLKCTITYHESRGRIARSPWGSLLLQEDSGELDESTTDGYVFDSRADLEEITMQRQAIWDLLKNLGSHLLREGVNLTKVSLPVKVFEPRSFLQRITDNWAYIDLLEKAVDTTDPIKRMQYVVSTGDGALIQCTCCWIS